MSLHSMQPGYVTTTIDFIRVRSVLIRALIKSMLLHYSIDSRGRYTPSTIYDYSNDATKNIIVDIVRREQSLRIGANQLEQISP